MDIRLTCPDCNTTFSIEPDEVLSRESIACPNCGSMLSDVELKALKIAIRHKREQH
ncbi:MAG: hypothetical protein H0Z39_11330 [Peptococcaceae bacterium]|nr:hypothetical protein [Peptococcaceae bacterium]